MNYKRVSFLIYVHSYCVVSWRLYKCGQCIKMYYLFPKGGNEVKRNIGYQLQNWNTTELIVKMTENLPTLTLIQYFTIIYIVFACVNGALMVPCFEFCCRNKSWDFRKRWSSVPYVKGENLNSSYHGCSLHTSRSFHYIGNLLKQKILFDHSHLASVFPDCFICLSDQVWSKCLKILNCVLRNSAHGALNLYQVWVFPLLFMNLNFCNGKRP